MTLKEHFRTNFNIRIQECEKGTPLTELLNGRKVKDFLCSTSLFKYNHVTIKADPFLFSKNGKLYLFYEEKLRKFKGVLKMVCSDDLVHWTDPVLILSEPFHLSFPYVFEDSGAVYLLPECGESNSIRLYKFIDETLSKVELVSSLVEGHYVDSSIIKREGKYYLFTSNPQFEQKLFISDNLVSGYKEHPSSPIYVGSDCGRNGGSVISYNDSLYRISQDCSRLYGGNVSVHKIEIITPYVYKETLICKNMLNKAEPFYEYGGHQFNIVDHKGKVYVATDALCLSYNLFQIIDKIKKKM